MLAAQLQAGGMAMPTQLSREGFDVLVAQAGLTLTAAQSDEIHAAYTTIEAMVARIGDTRPRSDEPALIFQAEQPE
jgi:hypothetical protein